MNDEKLDLELLESRLEMEALTPGTPQPDAILPYECYCNN